MINFLFKLLNKFKIPEPNELDKSINYKYNSLPMKCFGSPGYFTYTWEDYEKEIKIRYPFKYFILYSIPKFFKSIFYPIIRFFSNKIYYLKCHLFKKHKYHIINLTQSKESSYDYTYGYLDPDQQILLANFQILKNFVETEKLNNLLDTYSIEEINTLGLMERHQRYLDIMEIYNWWTIGRKELVRINNILYKNCKNKNNLHKYFVSLDDINDQDDEMLLKLFKIRKEMWY